MIEPVTLAVLPSDHRSYKEPSGACEDGLPLLVPDLPGFADLAIAAHPWSKVAARTSKLHQELLRTGVPG